MERREHTGRGAAPTLCLVLALALSTATADAAPAVSPDTACAPAVAEIERTCRVPRMLLQAVSLAESGRWNATARRSFAWPWTVTAKGKGTFHASRSDAIRAVRTLRKEGVRNIDVGCMQINLMHHKTAFETLEQAFDPAINAGYAANMIMGLRRQEGSWAHAIARYHSSDWQNRGRNYWRKVYRLWNSERRRDYRDRRADRIRRNREKILSRSD